MTSVNIQVGTGPSSSSTSKSRDNGASDLAGEEEPLLVQFRTRLAAVAASKDAVVATKLKDPRMSHADYLRKFLVARQSNLDKAADMLVAHFHWRDKMNCDEVLSQHRSGKLFSPSVIGTLKKAYPHGYCGVDKQGSPVYYERIGQLDVKEVLKTVSEEQFLLYFIAEAEKTAWIRMPAATEYFHRKQEAAAVKACESRDGSTKVEPPPAPPPSSTSSSKPRITKGVSVLDVQGIGMGFLGKTTRSVIAQIGSMMSDNYPESAKTIVIINSSRVATMLWPAVRAFINPDTAKKIKLVSKAKTFQTLEELIQPEWIPSWIPGGKCTLCGDNLDRDVGPWVEGWEEMEKLVFPNDSCYFHNAANNRGDLVDPKAGDRTLTKRSRSRSKALLMSGKNAALGIGRRLVRQHSQERSKTPDLDKRKSSKESDSTDLKKGGLVKRRSYSSGEVIEFPEGRKNVPLGTTSGTAGTSSGAVPCVGNIIKSSRNNNTKSAAAATSSTFGSKINQASGTTGHVEIDIDTASFATRSRSLSYDDAPSTANAGQRDLEEEQINAGRPVGVGLCEMLTCSRTPGTTSDNTALNTGGDQLVHTINVLPLGPSTSSSRGSSGPILASSGDQDDNDTLAVAGGPGSMSKASSAQSICADEQEQTPDLQRGLSIYTTESRERDTDAPETSVRYWSATSRNRLAEEEELGIVDPEHVAVNLLGSPLTDTSPADCQFLQKTERDRTALLGSGAQESFVPGDPANPRPSKFTRLCRKFANYCCPRRTRNKELKAGLVV
ncbi:unnamed protein product [Amoebophrya sp. A120]|nr:unnamed protein product [Amoebophrya sp. A120]|eukprot:GSA120T00004000001.1